MSKKKEETTDTTESTKPKRTKKSSPTKVVWVFGVHDKIAPKVVSRALATGSVYEEKIRTLLKVKRDTPIIPVSTGFRNRPELVQVFSETDFGGEAVVLVAGQSSDLQNKKVQALENQYALIWHPAERQFYLDTGVTRPGSYKKYSEELPKLEEAVAEHFELIADE